MKKLLIAMAVLAGATLVPVSKAQADCSGQIRYISNCGFCGGPFYQRYQVANYTPYGAEYGWVLLPHTCNSGAYNTQCHSSHSSRSHSSHRHSSSRHRHRH